MDCQAAAHRIRVGVPATVEHSAEEGVEAAKWVAETTQVSKPAETFVFLGTCPDQAYAPVFSLTSCNLCPSPSLSEFHHLYGCPQT